MRLKTIQSIQVKNKKVLLRVDFNVPIKNGRILDDSRIKAVLSTIKYLTKQRARAILISHLGDPGTTEAQKISESQKDSEVQWLQEKVKKQFSLKPIYKYLKNLRLKISFVDDCVGDKSERAINQMRPGDICLLENLRFYSEEKKNDLDFAKKLASLADIYINEAFSVCHRAHTSVSAVTKFLPNYAGLLLEKEVKMLSEVLKSPKCPFIVLIGGVKISTKIGVIKNLSKMADKILIGGALANNFFAAQGYYIGNSVYEKGMVPVAKTLLRNKKIILPIDVRIKLKAQNAKLKAKTQNVKLDELNKFKQDFKILDIGFKTTELFSNYLKSAKMIVWNGPMGYTEDRRFAGGTKEIIKSILANKKAKVVIGGGETLAALKFQILNFKFQKNVFVSMGGGAMLEFLEGKILPGLKPLLK